jgi:hypothetical protein
VRVSAKTGKAQTKGRPTGRGRDSRSELAKELAKVFLADAAKREDAAIRRHAEVLKELAQTKVVFHQALAQEQRNAATLREHAGRIKALEDLAKSTTTTITAPRHAAGA